MPDNDESVKLFKEGAILFKEGKYERAVSTLSFILNPPLLVEDPERFYRSGVK